MSSTMATLPVRRLFAIVNGGTPTADPSNWDGDVPWATPIDLARVDGGVLTTTERSLTARGLDVGSRAVPSGSLLVSTRAPIGYVAETSARTAFNQGCRGLTPRLPMVLRFYRYQFSALANQLQARGQGSTFAELSSDALAEFPLVAPALASQRSIVSYLDRETERIDALVAAKRRLAALLREKLVAARRSWLVQGLGSTSGIPLRRLVTCLDGQRVPLNSQERALRPGPFPYWGAGNIVDHIDAYLFDEDLVLLGEDGAPFFDDSRDVAFNTTGRVWVNNHIHVLRCNASTNPFWLRHMLNAVDYSAYVSGSTRDKLTQDEMMEIRLPLLNADEQEAARLTLDATEDRILRVSNDIAAQITLLDERRQALITAAVTGQLDVSEAA